jgi:hypothetical protein
LTPAETHLATEWAPGNYVVGLDIPPGRYRPRLIGQWPGNLQVFSTDGRTLVNLILDPADAGLADWLTEDLVLEDGQRVDIAGFTRLKFDPA